MSVAASALFGFFVVVTFLFCIQDLDRVTAATSTPVLQILVDAAGRNGGIALMSVIIACVWFCGLFSITSNSRMMFAFARDGGLPRFFDHVDGRFKNPYRASM